MLNAELSQIGDHYSIGIELSQALKNPGSNYDVILKEGDQLLIPEYSGTVRMSGAVMFPNTVVYREGARVSHYIDQAGGAADRAKKRKVFVVYMNGTIARGKRAKVMPGCEIIVPMKQQRRGLGLAEILSVANSTTSMAAMVTSIMNMTK